MGINTNGFGLLAQRQKKVDSLKQQSDAVKEQFYEIKQEVCDMQVTIGNKQIPLEQAVVTLSNFEIPQSIDEPQRASFTTTDAETGEEVFDEDGFNTQMQAYTTRQEEIRQAEQQKAALEASILEQTQDIDLDKATLDQLVNAAQAREDELAAANEEYQVSIQELEQLNAELKEATFVVTHQQGDKGMVESVLNQLRDSDAVLLPEIENCSSNILSDMCGNLVDADNERMGTNYSKNGMDSYYTRMKAGTTSEYTYAQMDRMAESLCGDLDVDFGLSLEDIEANTPVQTEQPEVTTEPQKTEPAAPNAQYKAGKDGEITLPRGIGNHAAANRFKKDDGNPEITLEDYGVTYDAETDTYRSTTNPEITYTADVINNSFRGMESLVDSNYTRYLNQAEALGIDIEAVISEVENPDDYADKLREAINTKKHENKVSERREKIIKKYDDDLKHFNIDPTNMTADDIARAVRDARREERRIAGAERRQERQEKRDLDRVLLRYHSDIQRYGIDVRGKTAAQVQQEIIQKRQEFSDLSFLNLDFMNYQ